jgi:hypothetical protein
MQQPQLVSAVGVHLRAQIAHWLTVVALQQWTQVQQPVPQQQPVDQ